MHGVASLTALNVHLPVLVSHTSAVHGLLSLHSSGPVETQLPALQVPPFWQVAAGSQGPLVGVWLQAPVWLLHRSAVQALPSSHALLLPTQLPAEQASLTVQASPSSHVGAPATGVKTQLASSWTQTSVVHGFLSSQTTGAPAHFPWAQTSPVVHTLPSEHGPLLDCHKHRPVKALQLSMVQGLASSQLACTPPLQLPALHFSPTVQALLSLQLPP